MRSRGAAAFAASAAIGILGVALVAGSDERDLAFTLGVAPSTEAARLVPDAVACQKPIDVSEPFTGVRFRLGPARRPTPPLELTVQRLPARATVARGTLVGAQRGLSEQSIAIDRTVAAGQRVAVCLRNTGTRPVALLGNAELAARTSYAEVDGERKATDLALVFTRDSRSALAQIPEMFERAALFRPAWVGAWTFWLLAALVLLAVPALLARAVAGASRDERL